LNSTKFTYRFVKSVDSVIDSKRHEYHNERGFVIPIAKSNDIKIPWGMLRECFSQLSNPSGYDSASFQERFPLQAQDHPCHTHVIGQIFVKACIAQTDGHKYQLL
jgi:hypothetical protein